MLWGRQNFKENAVIFLFCVVCYGPAIPDSTFVFDDLVAIVRNKDVTNIDCNIWTSIARIFRHDFWGLDITDDASHKSYRPFITLTYNIEYRIFDGGKLPLPAIMKCHNLIIHYFVCCILLSVLRQIFTRLKRSVSLLATILFAIHPVHTEAVSGIVGRADLMCSVFYLLALRTFCNMTKGNLRVSSQYTQYLLLMSYAVAALLCKEIGITVLPLCVLYEIIRNEKRLSPEQVVSRIFRKRSSILILCLGTGCLLLARIFINDFTSPKFQPMDNPVASANSTMTKILSQNYLYALNAWLLLCPDWLSCDWSFGSILLLEKFTEARSIAIIIVYLVLIVSFIRGNGTTHMAYGFIIISFLPASGIVKLGFVIAERILYIPSMGFCVLISMGWHQLYSYSQSMRKWTNFFLFFLCAIFVMKSMHRSKEWRNERALYISALHIVPNNAKIFYNIGRLASLENDNERATQYYLRAIELYSDYDAALMNLGNLYRIKNNLELAEKYISKSVRVTEEFPAAWMNLGIVKATKGQYAEALVCYNRALKYRKRYANCYYNLGNLHLTMNNSDLALQSWSQSLAINAKHSPSWANMLTLLDNQGKHRDVVVLSEKALKTLDNDPAILFLRANALGKLNRYDEAEKLYKEIIMLRPDHALYYVNLGVLYHRWNKKALAVDSYRRALVINPNLSNARKYLRLLQGIEDNSRTEK